jgi:hypothetical protein
MTKLRLASGAVLVCVLVAMMIAGGSAGAKPKFVPSLTTYHGTYSDANGTHEAFATVNHDGGKYRVDLHLELLGVCHAVGEFEALLPVAEGAALKGKTFKFHGKVPAESELMSNHYFTVTIKGHFTAFAAFTATVSATASVEPGNPEPTDSCTAGPVTLKMKA